MMLNSPRDERYLKALFELGSSVPDQSAGSTRIGYFWLFAALLWATWLLVSLVILSSRLNAPQSFWDLQDPVVLAGWLRAAAAVWVLRFAEFFLWGLLIALAVGYRRPGRTTGAANLLLAASISSSRHIVGQPAGRAE
jgi:hypothetical protein